MYIEIITTIKSRIKFADDGIDAVTHTVDIDGTEADGLGTDVIMLVVEGGCKSALKSIENKHPKVYHEDEDSEDDL